MRVLVGLAALLFVSGCAARRPADPSRAGVLGRPGDHARTSILGQERLAPRAVRSQDPFPALTRSDLRSEPLERLGGDARGGAYAPLPRPGAPLLGRWRLGGNGDVSMPLEGAWRMRVGLSAGGVPPESVLLEPGRRAEVYLVPGVRVERDL